MGNELAVVENGRLQLNPHPGQWKVWQSKKRFIVVLAGTQGGKTSFGPHWFYREIQQRGAGDYMIVTPTFTLLEKKALPEFLHLFADLLRLGSYHTSKRVFTFSKSGAFNTFGEVPETPTRVMFGYAANPDSLESATAKGAWLDECGQKDFKQEAYEAILRRLSLHQGRVLFTTTVYYLNWIKPLLYDPWERSGRNHPEIDVISFASITNPKFPKAEFERARRNLPDWKFRMFYLGEFTKLAGLIYDCFEWAKNVCKRFDVPDDWVRWFGLDFGGVNTVCVCLAEHPENGRFYLYRVYKQPRETAEHHAQNIKEGEPVERITAVGGAGSEDQWRMEFTAGGLPVRKPSISDVEVGIDRVYGAIKAGLLVVFDDLLDFLTEIGNYSRVVDGDGNPTPAIQDKSTFHLMDGLRYVGSLVFGNEGDAESAVVEAVDPLANLRY